MPAAQRRGDRRAVELTGGDALAQRAGDDAVDEPGQVPGDRELQRAAAGDGDVAAAVALARRDDLRDDAVERLLAAEALELQARPRGCGRGSACG